MSRLAVEGSNVRQMTLDREGSALIPTLDAHAQHPGVFSEQELTRFASRPHTWT